MQTANRGEAAAVVEASVEEIWECRRGLANFLALRFSNWGVKPEHDPTQNHKVPEAEFQYFNRRQF